MSDWEATHAGNATIQAGLDMNMPGGIGFTSASPSYFGQNLTMLVNNGSLPIESRRHVSQDHDTILLPTADKLPAH